MKNMEKTDDHLRIERDSAGGRERLNVLVPPYQLEVVMVPEGPDRGNFTLVARGRNDMNEVTVIQLRMFDKLLEAFVVFDLMQIGLLKAEDVPEFEITDKMLLTAKDRFRKLFQS